MIGEFRSYGQMDEPMMQMVGRMVKYVTRIADPDKHVVTILERHAGPQIATGASLSEQCRVPANDTLRLRSA